MSRLIKNGAEFVELKDNGTYVEHPTRFITDGNGQAMRIDRDDQGKETASIVPPKALLEIDSSTGDILGERRGFSERDEILGPPSHSGTGKEYVLLKNSDKPVGYDRETHKFDKATGKITKK